jgi:exosome complex component RRP42
MRQPTDALQIFIPVAVQVLLPLSFHSAAMLSQSEVEYIKGGCLEDCRVDGRSCREFRHHSLAVSSSPSSSSSSSPLLIRSNGSARMLLDGTHVLCSIKADIVRPSEMRPNQGAIELSVEYHPHASGSPPTGGGGRNKSRNDEDVLQQLLEDLLLPHLLDLTSLCLVRGELAWRLSIDLLVLACGAGCSSTSAGPGALLDAGAMTIIAALQNTWLPSVTVIAKEDEEEGEGETISKGPKPSSLGLGRGRDANNNDAATAELVVEGDMAKAQRVFELTNKEKGDGSNDDAGQQQQQQKHGAIHLVTVTILKCYATSPSAHEAPTARYVSLLDATCDEVACSHCQIHVAIRSEPAANGSGDPRRTAAVVVCALQTSGGGSVHSSLISDASQLAIAAAANRQRHVEVTDLSSLAGAASSGGGSRRDPGNETMLLQELYALQ